MNIDLVIAQLRTNAPIFGANVAGAAQYERGVQDQTWMALPAAYVVPLAIGADNVAAMTGYYQTIQEHIGVIVVLDNTADRRGQTAAATLDQLQQAVFAAILNWRPDSSADNPGSPGNPTGLASVQTDYAARGLAFDGAQLLGWDLARLFYQFDFVLETTISAEDGWQPPRVPLTAISITTSAPQVAAQVTLPQS